MNPPIVDVQRLVIHDLRHIHITLIKYIRGIILPRLRDRIHQLSTRVHTTKQHVHQSITGLLTGNTSVEDCGDVGMIDPGFHKDGACYVHDDDGVGAVGCSGVDEGFAAVPESEIVTVAGVAVDGDVTYRSRYPK